MNSLKSLALRMVLELARAPAVDVNDPAERARLEVVAEDVARAAWVRDGFPFRGEKREEALTIALVSLAFHESAFHRNVATCKVTGDRMPWHRMHEGRSITLWQLMDGMAWGGLSRRALCGNQALAAYRASGVLGMYAPSGSVGGVFRGYASGNSGRDTKAARKRCATWERLARKEGLQASCRAGLEVN